MSYVYIQSERSLWTVGFYGPDDKWNSESDHPTSEAAAIRVHWLNGGGEINRLPKPGDEQLNINKQLYEALREQGTHIIDFGIQLEILKYELSEILTDPESARSDFETQRINHLKDALNDMRGIPDALIGFSGMINNLTDLIATLEKIQRENN